MALKLVTRAQWGARAYRTPNGATPYSGRRRGIKLHYLGTPYTDRTHARCDDYVRQIQAQHMDGNGWSDIGYSFAVCTHGYVYEGRGLRRRNSANGNTTLNNQDYAILLLVGSSGLTKPTEAQLDGARDAIDYVRREGPAGSWLGGHRDGYATACPGDAVYQWAKAGAPRPVSEEDDMPSKEELYDGVMRYDGKMLSPWGTPDNPTWMAESVIERTAQGVHTLEQAVPKLAGQVGALAAIVAKLAEGGGLTAAEIQAAAEAGARAALDRLGDALTEGN
ncbi:peptidoglycan recognition family protein [Streptomyces sp. NPDC057367]|uniref:peptidoglycan recognition protein family protein n=1 Tax=Streptomyces sp. NPDC057367 TaxID=3346108 RepID=UPI0036428EA9